MTKVADNQAELTDLIANAQSQIRQQDAQRPKPRNKPSPLPGLLVLAVAWMVLIYSASAWWDRQAAPSQAQVAHDLEQVVDQARDVIEASRAQTGQLPSVMPNAALASVVQYHPESGQYQIVVSMMGVRVTLQKGGTKRTEVGIDP